MYDIFSLVGKTPFIKISDQLYAKYETYNPSGSIKDRIVSYIIKKAEAEGKLKKGNTIVEATSGNTGISLAMFGAYRGYNIKIIMPCDMSEERKEMIRMLGAEIIEVGAGDFDAAIALRDKLVKNKKFFTLNQFHNKDNINCHYETTSVEIIEHLIEMHRNCEINLDKTDISAFVAGAGTGGTLMGTRKRLIEMFPEIKTVVVEPAESCVMSGGKPGIHGIQGIGDGSKFLVDLDVVDDIMVVSTEDAKKKTRSLIKKGLLVGISSGANVLASERWIKANKPKGIVITVLSDRGERYLSCL